MSEINKAQSALHLYDHLEESLRCLRKQRDRQLKHFKKFGWYNEEIMENFVNQDRSLQAAQTNATKLVEGLTA